MFRRFQSVSYLSHNETEKLLHHQQYYYPVVKYYDLKRYCLFTNINKEYPQKYKKVKCKAQWKLCNLHEAI